MPNKNSYLALHMRQEDRDALYQLVSDCNLASGHRFNGMEYQSLHLTFLFFAEALSCLPRQRLLQFHDEVHQAVIDAHLDNQPLAFTGLELFPPTKQNLIVATFEASPQLQSLQGRVVELAQQHGIGRSNSERERLFGAQHWVPHCTLGKLKARSDDVTRLGESTILSINPCLEGIIATGLMICGQMPPQIYLDWNMNFRGWPGAESEEEQHCIDCVGSTTVLQKDAQRKSDSSTADSLVLLKRPVSFYLGPGSSLLLEDIGIIDEDDPTGV